MRRRTVTSWILVGVILMFISCSTDVHAPNLLVSGDSGYNFVQSHKQWTIAKNKHKNSYQYAVLDQSFTGYGSETTITVKEGEVVRRQYESFLISENDGSRERVGGYDEHGSEVGAHEEGAKPVTLDVLYNDCGSDYLMVDPDDHTLYFDTDEEGIISLCGNVPDLCADDCFVGFRLSMFAWLPSSGKPE